MNLPASLYQIDERGLELRRAYMGMTAAELDAARLACRPWADRNADAIGAKLAEHTFGARLRRPVPARLRQRQGHARRRPQARLGRRAGRPLQGRSSARRPSRAGSASPTSRACSASARCTASINLPLKWFLGTYPVCSTSSTTRMLRRRAGARARSSSKRFGRSSDERRRRVHRRRRARAQPRLQLRLAGDRRGLLLRHVHVDAA